MSMNPVEEPGPVYGAEMKKRKEPSVKPDAYVTLLFISAAALCIAATFFVLVLNEYRWEMGP